MSIFVESPTTRPFKNRPQKRKKGSGAGRTCTIWWSYFIGYVAGKVHLKVNRDETVLIEDRNFRKTHGLTNEWYLSVINSRIEFQLYWVERAALPNKTPQIELLHNRIYKMFWENGKPKSSWEHVLEKNNLDMRRGFQEAVRGQ